MVSLLKQQTMLLTFFVLYNFIQFSNIDQLGRMSSIQLSGISGISSDALQTRYQKALKQINKLIEINRQLKENSSQNEEHTQSVRVELANLRQENSELNNQNSILQSKYMQLQNHYRQLDDYCKKLQEELQQCHLVNDEMTQKLRNNEKVTNEQTEKQNLECKNIAKETELIRQTYQQNLMIIETDKKLKNELKKENQELRATINKLQEANSKLIAEAKEQHIQQMKIKLSQAGTYINKLMAECSELKNKQISQEALQQKQKMHQYIGGNLIGIDIKQNEVVKGLIFEYKKKIKTLEGEKKQLQQKFKSLVHQSKSPSKENYTKKIECLEKLTQKQQNQIARIIETYDRQINTIHKDNTKLKQNYNALASKYKQVNNQLTEKQKCINELNNRINKIVLENETLKKAHSNEVSEKETKIKQLQELKSLAILPKKQPEEPSPLKQEDRKVKNTDTQKEASTPSFNRKQTILPSQNHKIPITVRYGNPNEGQDNFKFIQNVNIINGFNLSLNSRPQV